MAKEVYDALVMMLELAVPFAFTLCTAKSAKLAASVMA
jgi:hypothetical protein